MICIKLRKIKSPYNAVATTFLVLNGDLVGHMSFVKRKIIAKPVIAVTRDQRCQNFLRILGFSATSLKIQPSILQISLRKSLSHAKEIW